MLSFLEVGLGVIIGILDVHWLELNLSFNFLVVKVNRFETVFIEVLTSFCRGSVIIFQSLGRLDLGVAISCLDLLEKILAFNCW